MDLAEAGVDAGTGDGESLLLSLLGYRRCRVLRVGPLDMMSSRCSNNVNPVQHHH